MKIISHLAATLLFLAASITTARASRLNPVAWSAVANETSATPGSTVIVYLRAKVDDGYHLYSLTTPKGGPIRTVISLAAHPAVATYSVYQPKPGRHTDPALGVPVETFMGTVDIPIVIHLQPSATGEIVADIGVRYQACSSEICLPPATRTVKLVLPLQAGASRNATLPGEYQLVGGNEPRTSIFGIVKTKDEAMASFR